MYKYAAMTSKDPAAVALGRKGGRKYAENATAEQRKAQARKAAQARWARMRELGQEITQGSKALDKTMKKNARRAKQKKAQS